MRSDLLFWAKVHVGTPEECWEWRGATTGHGYGKLQRRSERGGQSMWTAHRRSWFLTYGVMPGLLLHSCDNRLCVNPAHLSEGTQSKNTSDCYRRKRRTAPHVKLTEEQVRWIKQNTPKGRGAAVARELGVSEDTVCKILRGETWASVH